MFTSLCLCVSTISLNMPPLKGRKWCALSGPSWRICTITLELHQLFISLVSLASKVSISLAAVTFSVCLSFFFKLNGRNDVDPQALFKQASHVSPKLFLSPKQLCQTPAVKSRWLQTIFSTPSVAQLVRHIWFLFPTQPPISACNILPPPSLPVSATPMVDENREKKRKEITCDSLAFLSSLCLLLYLVQLGALLHPDPIVL